MKMMRRTQLFFELATSASVGNMYRLWNSRWEFFQVSRDLYFLFGSNSLDSQHSMCSLWTLDILS